MKGDGEREFLPTLYRVSQSTRNLYLKIVIYNLKYKYSR